MTHKEKDVRKADEICELKGRLIDTVKAQLNKGIEGIDAKELGETMRMIKELSEAEKCCKEAEKYCHEAEYYEKINKAMDDYDPDDFDDEEMAHADMRRPAPRRYRNMTGRRMGRTRYPGDDWETRGDWDSTMAHGDMIGNPMDIRTMDPEHQLMHLQKDVEAMWKDASPEYRKKLKENLSKWSTSLTA